MGTEQHVEVAIIGAGTAGLSALSEVRKVTENFLLINGGPAGTTCARVGCMPSKVLIQVAHDFHRRHVLAAEGIRGGAGLQVDLPAVLAHVRSLRDHFVRGVLKGMEGLGDRYWEGYARFREPTVLDVDGRTVHAKKIIIATGSSPVIPDAWRALGHRLITTDTFFEQASIPAAVAVIGLGVIGLEMGQALARLGLSITCFAHGDGIAGLTDPEVNAYMRARLQREMQLATGAKADVELHDGGVRVHSAAKSVQVDAVLASLGRRPQIVQLGLDALGVKLDSRGLPPYDATTLQVHHLPVFIAGDVNGDRPLLHEAADEGRIAGYNAMQAQVHCFQRRARLSIVFSAPQIAVVGSSFAELQRQDIVIGSASFETQGRATVMAEAAGLIRIYGDPQTGRLHGAELAAPDGEHLAHLLAWAIQRQMTVVELLQMPFYHPTVEEGLRTALRNLLKQVHKKTAGFELALCDSVAVADMA
ncbi:MAG TPA: dihydrolipoyl dehydrogenase [Burkholderiales bacterium]|nr:dihydrolipoyl dehydrogenase [Burkholderiales bacterium]